MTRSRWPQSKLHDSESGRRLVSASLLCTMLGLALSPTALLADDAEPPARSTQGQTSGRALLIGVGDYARDDADLPGIDLDLEMMCTVAGYLGFGKGQIKVIADAAATQAGVEAAISDWLVAGTGPGDLALLYFSGHGSQVPDTDGDEDDGKDEVLVLHDFDLPADGQVSGVLMDDRLNALLRQIRARQTLLIVDACHSGTSDKGFSSTQGFGRLELQAKFYSYPGMPTATGGSLIDKGGHRPVAIGGRYVGLFAARDDEKSRASSQGSIFTLGLLEALQAHVRDGGDPTPKSLLDGATAFVARELDPAQVFHPQLGGDKQLQMASLPLVRPERGAGPRWRESEALVGAATGRIQVTPGSAVTRIGVDKLTLSVEIPAGGGYLNVIEIGDDDEPTVLFPNAYHSDNHLGAQAQTFRFPTPQMGFELQTTGPAGKNLIAAFVTREPLNLYASGYKTNKDLFASVTQRGLSTLAKAISTTGHGPAAAGQDPFWAGMTHVEVTE